MPEYRGSTLYVSFKGTALNADFREFTVSEEIDTIDASAGADVAKTYLTGLEDGTASLTLLAQTAGSTVWNLLDKGAEGSLIWAPEGTAAGKDKHYVNAIVTSREKSIPYDDAVEISVEFQFSGAVTDTIY